MPGPSRPHASPDGDGLRAARSNLYFRLVSYRYGRGSILITTNPA
jgi:hypothetical protein